MEEHAPRRQFVISRQKKETTTTAATKMTTTMEGERGTDGGTNEERYKNYPTPTRPRQRPTNSKGSGEEIFQNRTRAASKRERTIKAATTKMMFDHSTPRFSVLGIHLTRTVGRPVVCWTLALSETVVLFCGGMFSNHSCCFDKWAMLSRGRSLGRTAMDRLQKMTVRPAAE